MRYGSIAAFYFVRLKSWLRLILWCLSWFEMSNMNLSRLPRTFLNFNIAEERSGVYEFKMFVKWFTASSVTGLLQRFRIDMP